MRANLRDDHQLELPMKPPLRLQDQLILAVGIIPTTGIDNQKRREKPRADGTCLVQAKQSQGQNHASSPELDHRIGVGNFSKDRTVAEPNSA